MPVLTPEYLILVFLVFVRIGGLMVAAPFFGHRSVPVKVRIFFSAVFAWGIVGLVPGPLPPDVTQVVPLLLAVLIEALTGLALGFAAQFIFFAVSFAGEVIGFQMGLSMAQIYNPAEGLYSNPLGRLLGFTFLMVFLLIDGHHHVMRALMASFEVVPLAGAQLTTVGPILLEWTGTLFVTALRLASPFMVTIFLVDTALGVFARVVPQADLFSVGLPLKLLTGLGMMVFFLQNFFPAIPDLIAVMLDDLLYLVEALAGP
jgi:flagellar biosynthetic protein FliR